MSNLFQDIIDIIRGKKPTYKTMCKNNNIQIDKKYKNKIKLNVLGKNNKIIIEQPSNMSKCAKLQIQVLGDNNEIIIKKGLSLNKTMDIMLSANVKNSSFQMDEDIHVSSMYYVTINSNTYCKIGKNCMFGSNVTLFNTDAHPIIDINTKELINKIKGIEIQEHCWCCTNSTIMKNSIVPKGSIVGYGAIFAGEKYKDKINVIFAGNPARLVKENVDWERDERMYGYVENEM